MTVCIGALCVRDDKTPVVIVAADRMVTYGAPMNLQHEPELSKIYDVTDHAVILGAGSAFDAEAVAKDVRAKVGEADVSVAQIAQTTVGMYAILKAQRVSETILRPNLNLDFASYIQLAAQAPASQLLNQIMMLVNQHNLGLELLVAGVDDQGAHLEIIPHPGFVLQVGQTGFAAIGSGGLHASVWLSLANHTSAASDIDTLYNVFHAKKAAEVAPGVGSATNLAIIAKGGKTRYVSDDDLKALEQLRQGRPTVSPEDRVTLGEMLKKYAN